MGTVYGVPYDHLQKILGPDGLPQEIDWLDASDHIVAKATFDGTGGYDLTLQGKLLVQKRTFFLHGEYYFNIFQPGTAFGNHFDYYRENFAGQGVPFPSTIEWRDASDKLVASEDFTFSGSVAAIYVAASGTAWGVAYTAFQNFYDPDGLGPDVVTRKVWFDADFLVAEETFSQGGYDVYAAKTGTAFGRAYFAVDEEFFFPSSSQPSRVTYYTDQGTITQTFGLDGSYDALISTGTADLSSYDVFVDSAGFHTRTDYYDNNGRLARVDTFQTEGRRDDRVYGGGVAWGLSYASVDYSYLASDDLPGKETYFKPNGDVLMVKSMHADHGYDVEIFLPAVSNTGVPYASRDYGVDSLNRLTDLTLFDADHKVVEHRSY